MAQAVFAQGFDDVALVRAHEFFRKHLWKTAAAFLRHGRVEVLVETPVLELVQKPEQRLAAEGTLEARGEFFRIETVGELDEGVRHRLQEGFLVREQVLADLTNRVAGTEVFAIVPDKQLLDQVARVLRQLDRVVVARKYRRLVEPERRLEIGPVLEQLLGAFDEFAQDLAGVVHRLGDVEGGMQLRATDLQSVEERIEEIVAGHFGP